VLAAILRWAEKRGDSLADEQLAALFSRIRFPDVPSSTLFSYHRIFETLRRFDPSQELILRAVSLFCLSCER